MEVLGLIPARGGSKGIPGKNIKPLLGKPLIGYTFESALSSTLLTRRLLTTDSKDIADLGLKYGIEVPFLRPSELADDNSSAFEYIEHCLQFLETSEGYCPDVVVLLQPTCPFREGQDIDFCISLLESSDADSVVSVSALPTKYHPNWQFKVSEDGLLHSFSGGGWGELAIARQHLDATYTRNGAVYVFRRKIFNNLNTIYGNKVLAYIMPEERSVNIDDLDDWQKAEAVIVKKQKS
ncbi:cytidylyltransferase domain-containing protein [Methylomonas methanica]|uniref:N-acylneuraminate cytidylyltransferase n=1 Tax=Methylomonas methanica (strain DSM 25384 / MC09) TaxID=857087 RepID=F9ZWC1_METMM|nr:acylneuraminate cytidylyltransferase family protein [Methylomonas methanica]AEF99590.1 N-acylneuraminate cytidylyltransferase [Methylomonas methanica MC09]